MHRNFMHGGHHWSEAARGRGRAGVGPGGWPGRPPGPPGPPGAPFGAFDPAARLRKGRGRRRKGDVREAVLVLLAERPMHGYEMISELGERTEGVWRPSPGSVYPTLQMLEDEGLVHGEKADGRRMYALTDSGREHVERREGRPAPWEEVTEGISPAAMNLRGEIASVAGAAGQVMMVGSREQQNRALEILAEARRRLYGILAEDDTPGDTPGDMPPDASGEPAG